MYVALLLSHMDGIVNRTLLEASPASGMRVAAVRCLDGFEVELRAGSGALSSPKRDQGPWTEVETRVLSLSEIRLLPFADSPDAYPGGPFMFVPIDLLEEILSSHGIPGHFAKSPSAGVKSPRIFTR